MRKTMPRLFWLLPLAILALTPAGLNAEEHPLVLVQRGERFLAMGNFDAALANYQKVLRHYPNSQAAAEAHNDIGVIYARQGLDDQAALAYGRSLAINDYPLAKLNLGKLHLARFAATGDEQARRSALELLSAFRLVFVQGNDLPPAVSYNREQIESFLNEALASLQPAVAPR